ncbi:MAG: acyl-CoA thioesterase [Chloroflexi bacterium]|nr:acyl-CoA thioesterase [Chloroflexota bacterium]
MVNKDELHGKSVGDSRVTLAVLMQPEHANSLGNVHGGWIMKLVDEAGGLASMRHAQQRVVTVAVDQLTFKHPIRIGDLVTLFAEVSYTGRTSLEVEVRVTAENPLTGEAVHTNTAFLVYVAIDEAGVPIPVPPLNPRTEQQKERMKQAKLRQKYRIKHAKQVEKEIIES